MDFTLSDEQQAIADLAGTILTDRCPPEALRQLERTGSALAADAWKALAAADLLGLAVPEAWGGSGLGVVEAGLVAEQVGRHVAPVPYWPSTAAAVVLARHGTDEQRRRWLLGAVDGTGPLTVALWEPGTADMAHRPSTAAARDGDGWRLDGAKQPVPWAAQAAAMLVPARLEDGGVGLFVVEPTAEGVSLTAEAVISREPQHTVNLRGVPVTAEAVVAGPDRGPAALALAAELSTVLLCTTALGVAEEALALTARHVTEREQFGSPIGTFQAVAHRCADAYIDTEAIRLTAWQAAWRIDAGLPAADAVAVAAFWAAGGGQRVVHAAQHLHGGIGVDTDYPLHRYFRWAKVLELLVGGSTGALLRLGSSLAAGDDPAPPTDPAAGGPA